MIHNLSIGKRGEQEAVKYLLADGYKILKKNFYSRWGEIDLIAVKETKLSFVEVKTRVSDLYGKPHDAVTFRKKNNLRRPIQYFLLKNDYKNYKLSLDVISLILNQDLTIKSLRHFKNAFTY